MASGPGGRRDRTQWNLNSLPWKPANATSLCQLQRDVDWCRTRFNVSTPGVCSIIISLHNWFYLDVYLDLPRWFRSYFRILNPDMFLPSLNSDKPHSLHRDLNNKPIILGFAVFHVFIPCPGLLDGFRHRDNMGNNRGVSANCATVAGLLMWITKWMWTEKLTWRLWQRSVEGWCGAWYMLMVKDHRSHRVTDGTMITTWAQGDWPNGRLRQYTRRVHSEKCSVFKTLLQPFSKTI
jgi:hypothetical protein